MPSSTNRVRVLVAMALAVSTASHTGCVVGGQIPEDVYLVAVSPPTSTESLSDRILASGGVPLDSFDRFGIVQAALDPSMVVEVIAWRDVEIVERDLGFSSDSIESAPMPASPLQTEPWGVRAVGGPVEPRHALWVVDSGVDPDHPDLLVDGERSYDAIARRDPEDAADTAHGTAVAGVAAALDNDEGVVGVAPGALVVSVRVLDSSRHGATSDLLAGLEYVHANAKRGDVVNISLSSPGTSATTARGVGALLVRGIRVVVAAGNSGSNVGDYSPASIERDGVWTVGANRADDCIASFSNRGAGLDLLAPGVDIVTLAPGGGLAVFQGTSLAAPHVAGLLLADALVSRSSECDEATGQIASAAVEIAR